MKDLEIADHPRRENGEKYDRGKSGREKPRPTAGGSPVANPQANEGKSGEYYGISQGCESP